MFLIINCIPLLNFSIDCLAIENIYIQFSFVFVYYLLLNGSFIL